MNELLALADYGSGWVIERPDGMFVITFRPSIQCLVRFRAEQINALAGKPDPDFVTIILSGRRRKDGGIDFDESIDGAEIGVSWMLKDQDNDQQVGTGAGVDSSVDEGGASEGSLADQIKRVADGFRQFGKTLREHYKSRS